jgi:uncharacterized protein YutE (UPF0331/DUF86 family)/predicted nucleotidyltransferase
MSNVSRDEIENAAREVMAGQPWVAVAYLFGSVAQGRAGPLSDVDIGYLPVDARDADSEGRLLDQLVLRLGREDVDLLDLRHAPFPLRFRAVRDGRVLFCRDELARERFEVEAVLRYLDFKPLRDAGLRIAARGTAGVLMVADVETVRDRERRILRYVEDLRQFARITPDAFAASRERQYAVLHALQLAIEASVEIATHICSSDGLGTPGTYAEAFGLLESGGVLGTELAEDLRRMARFRNRIVHFYSDVDLDDVYRILQERLGDFDRYVRAVERYLAGQGPATGA